MKRLLILLLSVALLVAGCATASPNDSSAPNNLSGSSAENSSRTGSEDASSKEASQSQESLAYDNSTPNSSNAESSHNSADISLPEPPPEDSTPGTQESSEDSNKLPEMPEGYKLFEGYPGRSGVYCWKGVSDEDPLRNDGGRREYVAYYKLMGDRWEKLPVTLFEQSITIPHLREGVQECFISLWVVWDGNIPIDATNAYSREETTEVRLVYFGNGPWLSLSRGYYYLLWDEDSMQFVDALKDVDLSMNDPYGWQLAYVSENGTKALFRGYNYPWYSVEKYFADLTTGKVYALEEVFDLAGEELQVGILTDTGAIGVSGMQHPETYISQLSPFKAAYGHIYAEKVIVDGFEFILWQMGDQTTIRFFKNDSGFGLSPVVHIRSATETYYLDLSVVPEDKDWVKNEWGYTHR